MYFTLLLLCITMYYHYNGEATCCKTISFIPGVEINNAEEENTALDLAKEEESAIQHRRIQLLQIQEVANAAARRAASTSQLPSDPR